MDKKKTTNFCEYLKYSILFCLSSNIWFFFITLIEITDLLTNIIDQIIRIFYFNQQFNIDLNQLSKQVLSASPYNCFFKALSSSIKTDEILSLNSYFIIFYFVLMIHFIVFFISLPKSDFHIVKNIEKNIYYKIVVNFYDYIFHRPLAIYALDLFSREIMKLLFIKEYDLLDYILLFFYFIFLIIVYIWHIVYIRKVNTWINFFSSNDCLNYYPFDYFFGSKYDIILLTIKLLIAVNKNYEYFNGDNVDYIITFNIFLMLLIFYGFSVYIIYLLFLSDKCLYIFDTFFNKFRIFNVLLLFELISLRILLHSKDSFKSFYVFFVFFILFDLYIFTYSYSDFIFTKGIKCQNYLAVGFYFLSNKIDLNSFITQWIMNHFTICINKNCPICNELGSNENIINTEDFNEKKSKTSLKDDIINKKNNSSQNKLNSKNYNSIIKIFTPYKFNLKIMELVEKYKDKLDYEDSIRFDFLYLTGLILSNQNIEFLLYSELCLLTYKYKDNKNILATIRLTYNNSRKVSQEQIKNFELLKKNDDLLLSLKNFIQDYESFINYSSKSPENYLAMSKKFKNFKDTVKNIHAIFKKNLEKDYQLIIMTYAYDTILHQNFKNEQSFDFSIYNEFLIDRFEKDKIILIKYLIDKDIFTIVKCSNDFIRYLGNNLEEIFPDYLKISSTEKLREQLKMNKEKENNKIFEFIIKSTNNNEKENFIEAFRFEYFIYPTYNINELFIFGKKYTIGYTDYIIYKINKDRKDYIFSFSYRIYKYLGITPEMLSILRKSGVFIESEMIFTPKEKNNDAAFILKYANYYNLYEKIVNFDGFMDLPDYSTIIERKKEFKNMAKEEKEIVFIITLKGEYNYSGGKLTIYNIKEKLKKNDKSKRNSIKEKEEKDSEDLSYELSGEREYEYNNNSINGQNSDLASSISSTSYKDPSQANTGAKGKQNDKNYERMKSLNTIKRFTIIILIFDIFLIILSGLFLFLEVSENNSFQKVFDLFQTFKIFKRGIESSPLSLLSNYKFINNMNDETKEVISTISMYEDYSNELVKKYPIMNNVPKVYELIQIEIYGKYSSIIEAFNDYLSVLFKMDIKAALKAQNIEVLNSALQKEEKITILISNLKFISLCREYNNFMSNLLLDNVYLEQNISLLNTIIVDDYNYIVETQFDFEFTSSVKNMLLLIFSYPSIHIGLSESSDIMQNEFRSSKNFMEKLLIIFFLLLIISHIILIMIYICFFITYLRLLKINIYSTNKLFMDKKYIKFQSKRLELIKIINNLYSVNPVILSNKITARSQSRLQKTVLAEAIVVGFAFRQYSNNQMLD